jgi:hypothetical protein
VVAVLERRLTSSAGVHAATGPADHSLTSQPWVSRPARRLERP